MTKLNKEKLIEEFNKKFKFPSGGFDEDIKDFIISSINSVLEEVTPEEIEFNRKDNDYSHAYRVAWNDCREEITIEAKKLGYLKDK